MEVLLKYGDMNELELLEHNQDWFWSEMHGINKCIQKHKVDPEYFFASKTANIPDAKFAVFIDRMDVLSTSGFETYSLKNPELWRMGIKGDSTCIAIPIAEGQRIYKQLKEWFHCVKS